MPEHDPLKFVAGLGAKLAARSRHVCFFLGAGISRACGLPDIQQLQQRVLARLNAKEQSILATQLDGRNLEQALSRLRRMAVLLTGSQRVDDLTANDAAELDRIICQAIVAELDIVNADLKPVQRFGAWAARSDYHVPVELFTVNYDLLLETALEDLRVPYFDGFIGNIRARFHTELVEGTQQEGGISLPACFVRLWKLHGSVNWLWENDQQIVRLGQPVVKDMAAAIYPSDTKYEESRRVPFVVLQDRLRRSLLQSETLVIIAGYSFSDDHLNELIFDAAARRQRSEFVAFCYSKIPELLATKATLTPNLQVVNGREAILGALRADWKQPKDAPTDIWDKDEFALRDFKSLSAYLARSAAREAEPDAVLQALSSRAYPVNQETEVTIDA